MGGRRMRRGSVRSRDIGLGEVSMMDIFDAPAGVLFVGGGSFSYMRAITIQGFLTFDIWWWPYCKHITICELDQEAIALAVE